MRSHRNSQVIVVKFLFVLGEKRILHVNIHSTAHKADRITIEQTSVGLAHAHPNYTHARTVDTRLSLR